MIVEKEETVNNGGTPETVTVKENISPKPITQEGIKALIDECKAYVQSKKQQS
ncbi:MAG: hypothetical protein J6Y02_03770 [Pseudobutyrivibrio sp.]|nr:hypothetical protein [Pseudobutyrivibrio sp.]